MNAMRNTRTKLLALLAMTVPAISVLTISVLAVPAVAGDEPSQDEMMQAYMEAARPGPEHEMLAKGAGEWECTMKSWMDPNGEPMVSQGTETAKMVLGGRYLETEYDGQAMGMPFQGRGVVGYDNVKKKYVGTWYDSMSTGIMSYEGDYDPAKKELVCHGDFVDAMTGETMTSTLVSRFVSDDHHVFEMWGPSPSGENVKWMEIVYERVE